MSAGEGAAFDAVPPPGTPYAPGMKGYVVRNVDVAEGGVWAVPGPYLGPDHHPAPDGPVGPSGYHPLASALVWPTKSAAGRAVRAVVPRGRSVRAAGFRVETVALAEWMTSGVRPRGV